MFACVQVAHDVAVVYHAVVVPEARRLKCRPLQRGEPARAAHRCRTASRSGSLSGSDFDEAGGVPGPEPSPTGGSGSAYQPPSGIVLAPHSRSSPPSQVPRTERMQLHPLQQLMHIERGVLVVQPDHEAERDHARPRGIDEAAAERVVGQRPAHGVDHAVERPLGLPDLLDTEREDLRVWGGTSLPLAGL